MLVLSSQLSVASEAAGQMRSADGLAVSVAASALDHWLRIKTLAWTPGRALTYADRAVKRNVALLVARMMRWRRVLFLDDDISGIRYSAIRGAVAHVGSQGTRLAGWRAILHPDNSVVCHAFRAVCGDQDVFITGGALLLYVPGWLPFFPAVYNEDWLFVYDLLARQKVGQAGTARQAFYSPFEDMGRAIREEFGDVLAEGLMGLLHERRSVQVACMASYWPGKLDERRTMLDYIESRLWNLRHQGDDKTADGHDVGQVMMSIEAAHEELDGITPNDLAEFTSAWRHDLYLWNSRLPQLPRFTRIEEALNWLGLYDIHHANGG